MMGFAGLLALSFCRPRYCDMLLMAMAAFSSRSLK